MKRREIAWQAVLGPLAGATNGLDSEQIAQLECAASSYSRRAIRLRPGIKGEDLPFETEPVPWFDRGRFLTDNQVRPGGFLNFAAADYAIQDAASMLPIALAGIRPGQSVCDVCAAPGGKSTAIAEILGGQGLLVANEVIRSRLSILELALARSGYGNHLILNLEVEQLAALCGDSFDCVLVDAPCTGQSMVAKGKQTSSAYSQRQIEHCTARQRRIVRSAIHLVRPGGRLVYSTCTFSYQENEAIFQLLSDELTDWQPVVDGQLAAWAGQLPGTYRLWPHRDQCAGGFSAVLDRPVASEGSNLHSGIQDQRNIVVGAHTRRSGKSIRFADLDLPLFTVEHTPGEWIARDDGSVHRFQEDSPRAWIDFAFSGVEIARFQAGVWTPSYPSATINPDILSAKKKFELSDAEAARFMAGESLRCSHEQNGWAVVSWQSRPLAWGKLSAGSLKNHLPRQLRTP